jgi:hypothetical protein
MEVGPTIRDLESILGIDQRHIVYAFVFGSRLYGTARPDSGRFACYLGTFCLFPFS